MKNTGSWNYMILDAMVDARDLGPLAAGDIDGDGKVEIVAGGDGGLFWYRPDTYEKGIIAVNTFFLPGIAFEDIDRDGLLEVAVAEERQLDHNRLWSITWYKPQEDLSRPWTRYVIDPSVIGRPNDLVFADLDGDGEMELLANAANDDMAGVFIYKKNSADSTVIWTKYEIQTGFFAEGLAAADLDGDGKMEIVSGPDWYSYPSGGPFSGTWKREGSIAPSHREKCRVSLLDITGNGRPDVVIVESDYVEGKLSWFENRIVEDPQRPWIERGIDGDIVFGHSLSARKDSNSGDIRVFVGEMPKAEFDAPRNFDARLMIYSSADDGATWESEVVSKGSGTYHAFVFDLDGDGEYGILGKDPFLPQQMVQIWERSGVGSPIMQYRHTFLDKDKPNTATDMVTVDVDGDGKIDVVCGSWWYKNPTWERYTIPGIYQVINAYDLDGDGRMELIATKANPQESNWYAKLCSDLYWIKPVDPVNGEWEEYRIGTGSGDWPHGSLVGPFLPGGRLALIIGYHHARKGQYPEIFEVPDDPRKGPWNQRIIAEILYGEEFVACDIDGDGKLDIVAGSYWLENEGNGHFQAHLMAEDFQPARVAVFDVNGDGRPDIILGEEVLSLDQGAVAMSRLVWLENSENPKSGLWNMHTIDYVRCVHSIGLADLDGDGEIEIIAGEHDPVHPYQSQCKTLVYKKAEKAGNAWQRFIIDDRFEHHVGTKTFAIEPGRIGIVSHGWKDSRYVHLWERKT